MGTLNIVREDMYIYAGYDLMHQMIVENGGRNHFKDTKTNILKYLKEEMEFSEGTSTEERDEHIDLWFNCYCKKI